MVRKQMVSSSPGDQEFSPARIVQVEISQPLPDITAVAPTTGQQYQRAVALVRLCNRPIGTIELRFGENGITAVDCAHAIWQGLAAEIITQAHQLGLPGVIGLEATGICFAGSLHNPWAESLPGENAPLVSIVIATRNRPETLAICLRSLFALDYPNFEIIVVDNAPSSEATAVFMQQTFGDCPNVHYLREDTPGLAIAHNRGLLEVAAPIVAFTDDDVVVDKHWLTEIVKAFEAGDNVACVTGMIFPVELETAEQMWIEQYGGFSKGYTRRVFDLQQNRLHNPLYPYAAGSFGSGANMAFKTDALRQLGGFDPALGAGSGGVGGDDLAAFFDVVTAGYQLVYEPAALVYHRHHREYDKLRRQMYGYGVGLTAYLTKTVIDKPTRFFDLVFKVPQGLAYAFSSRSAKNQNKTADYPKELTIIERKGMLFGPLAYVRSRKQARKIKQDVKPLMEHAKAYI